MPHQIVSLSRTGLKSLRRRVLVKHHILQNLEKPGRFKITEQHA